MNSRQKQAEQTKQKLIEATFSIIRDKGFQELSANKIAEVAGLSKSGFFHHFAQIEDLYIYMLDTMIGQFDKDLDPSKFKNFEKYICFVSDYMMNLLDENPERGIALFYFISESQHNDKYRNRLKSMMENSFDIWSNKISFFFKVPLNKSDRDFLIRIIDIYFSGFSTHYLMFKDKKRYRKLSKNFGNLIVNFVENRNPGH